MLVEALVDASEHFVGLVDQAQVEGRRRRQSRGTGITTRRFTSDEEHSGARHIDRRVCSFDGFDSKQRVELVLPLSEQWSRNDDENPGGALRQELRDDESGFDRLSQANFISKDAAAMRNAPKRKHHGVDLVRIGVDAPLELRRRLTPAFSRRPKADEVLGKVAPVDGVADAFSLSAVDIDTCPEIGLADRFSV